MAGGKRAALAVVVTVLTLLVPARAGLAQDTPPAETTQTQPDAPPTPPPEPAPIEPAPPEPSPPSEPTPEPAPPPADAAGSEATEPAPVETTPPAPTPAQPDPGSVELEDPSPAPSPEPPAPTPPAPSPALPAPVPPEAQPPAATITLEPPAPQAEPDAGTITITVTELSEPAVEAAAPETTIIDDVSPVKFAARDPADAVARLALDVGAPPDRPVPPRIDDAVQVAGVERRCVRLAARVPLSSGCEQARAVAAVLGVAIADLPGPGIRAAIERATSRLVVRRFSGRGPPAEKAAPRADKPPMSMLRDWGLGLSHSGHKSSVGSSTTSRLFVLIVPPLRPPAPFRFPERAVPIAVPRGAPAAPPRPRPG